MPWFPGSVLELLQLEANCQTDFQFLFETLCAGVILYRFSLFIFFSPPYWKTARFGEVVL